MIVIDMIFKECVSGRFFYESGEFITKSGKNIDLDENLIKNLRWF
jgi:hypothetical protein